MNKQFNLLMIVMVLSQYLIPITLTASEISSYTSEMQSESYLESEMPLASEIESETISEESSEVTNNLDSQQGSETDQVSSQANTPKIDISSRLLAEQSVQNEPINSGRSVMPSVEYNVVNFDAPSGYFVPEESNILGASTGHDQISHVSANWDYIDNSKGYAEWVSNDPGTLQPDGSITYNTCWDPNDDKARWDCEGYFFPLNTNVYWGGSSQWGMDEDGIIPGEYITMYYPEALVVNGNKYDVKSTFSNFYKDSDSLGINGDGWFTTLAVSHYFYDGYWMNDFQGLTEEMTIYDSVSGQPVDLSDLAVYDFRFGMMSLNNSSDDTVGAENHDTAEAIRPGAGIVDDGLISDGGSVQDFCNMYKGYHRTISSFAGSGDSWIGGDANECNGIAFKTESSSTIEFSVGKNSTQPDQWGNVWWEIAWFVPLFWATSLPDSYYDAGDAPQEYGTGQIQIDGDEITPSTFYLGDGSPSNDNQSDDYGHTDGLNDDNNPVSQSGYDDETGFANYTQDADGFITFTPSGSTITLEVPYVNETGRSGQIVIWVDWNGNSVFEQSEATVTSISSTSTANITLNVPSDTINGDTYMRVVMTDDLADITDKGNAIVYPGVGEVEDYPLHISSDTLISKSILDSDGDGKASLDETLTYSIEVTNTSDSVPITNVEVRDSLLENLPDWIRFNNDVELTPNHPHSGNLTAGNFVIHEIPAGETVTITFTVQIVTMPNGITSIDNIATDDGSDPTDCPPESVDIDCDSATIQISGGSVITKQIINETGLEDGVAEYREDITYQITVSNPTSATANNIEVRDSLLENMPTWIELVSAPVISPVGTTVNGSLSDGDFVIDHLNSGESVTITYTIHINDIPLDVEEIPNVATDNGDDPTVIDPSIECGDDCAIVNIPPETVIEKTVKDQDDDGEVSIGEELTYTITVTNPANVPATLVNVRDSLYENITNGTLDFLSISSTPTISPSLAVSGDLGDGSYTISELPANSEAQITFKVIYNEPPSGANIDIVNLLNVVTDNGTDPSIIDPETSCDSDDCSSVLIPLLGDTIIDKSIISESLTVDGIAERGEEVTYSVTITNPNNVPASEVHVRDSVLENLVTYDFITVKAGSVTVDPSDTAYSGNVTNGDLVIDNIDAGQSVTVTYTLIFGDYPDDMTSLENWVTDNNQDPETCSVENEDCAEAIIDLNPDPTIEKHLVSESLVTNGIVEAGEQLTYELTITNDQDQNAININVRDSLLENTPASVTWDGNFTVDPITTSYGGDLGAGTFIIYEIPANSSVTITYTVTAAVDLTSYDFVANIATDNGREPKLPCFPASGDCAITIHPTTPETVIYKSVVDSGSDGLANIGDTLTYTIEVNNPTIISSALVPIHDSLVTAIVNDDITYLDYDGNLTIVDSDGNPLDSGTDYTGSLETDDLVLINVPANSSIFISFDVVVTDIPTNVDSILNIATDDGSDPLDCDEISSDCAGVITPVDPETIITKSSSISGDAVAVGDSIDYQITITNPNEGAAAVNVEVRDSLIANLPSYLKLTSYSIDPSDLVFSGLLSSGDITIASIPANSSVTITYTLEVLEIPNNVETIVNIVTDDGTDPSTLTPELCLTLSDDCSSTEVAVDPETTITKSVIDEDENGIVEAGEKLYYTIAITNPGSNNALDVNVNDKLVSDITGLITRLLGDSSYLTYDGNLQLTLNDIILETPDDYSGDLSSNDLIINSIPPQSTVYITFSITVDSIPDDITAITNVATDNGDLVETCDDLSSDDCATTTIPTNPKTLIEKSQVLNPDDGLLSIGDEITYNIDITNPSDVTALNVIVRDSLLENLPPYLEIVGNLQTTPSDLETTGDLSSGITISEIPAGSTVTLSYTLKLIANPDDDAATILNIATDDNTDPDTLTPELCLADSEDCSSTEVIIDANTSISKALVSESGEFDGTAENGELLTYQITVANNTENASAFDVEVRDSLLENLPTYLSLEGGITITPPDTIYSGSLTTGDFVISEISANQTVTITYSLRVSTIPNEVTEIANTAVTNGLDPDVVLPEVCSANPDDCNNVVLPIHPETIITKTAEDQGKDGYVSRGEEIIYTITVTNPTDTNATDVIVRDSLYSNVPSYAHISTPFEVSGGLFTTPSYSGDLANSEGIVIDQIDSGKTVEITYGITLDRVPLNGVTDLINIATDNGDDPTVCEEISSDCAGTITPMESDTVITKKLVSEDGDVDGAIESGETLTYSINVRNLTSAPSLDVIIRDSLIEGIANGDYPWLVYNGIEDIVPNTLQSTGSLEGGDYTISTIPGKSQVTITYTITVLEVPNDVSDVLNVATDNGDDGSTIEACTLLNLDCSSTITPVIPETIISKTVNSGADQVASVGEEIFYTIEVTNPSITTAPNVVVRDSLLENLPSYVTFNDNIVVSIGSVILTEDTDYSGDLLTSGIMIDQIPPGKTVRITYSVTLDSVPLDGAVNLPNVVTDNGEDPDIQIPEVCVAAEDCSSVITPIDPDTEITKQIIGESFDLDNQAQIGEEITYQITVSNPTDAIATDVAVRDSLLENMPPQLELSGAIIINPDDYATGSLTDGTFVLTQIPAKSTVTITYTLLVLDIPDDVTEYANIATDNGADPDITDPSECISAGDCGNVVIDANPPTVITKIVSDESIDVNGIAEPGETITYQILIENESDSLSALDVPVRDSLIEAIANDQYPDYTYGGVSSIDPNTITTKGSLEDGDFTIDQIAPNQIVTITYTVTLSNSPTQTDKFIGNLVTDNGGDPTGICSPLSDDCDFVIIPKEPDTLITKQVADSDNDGYASVGETLTYTVEITNPTNIPAENVKFRDSLIEAIELNEIDYLSIVPGSLEVLPNGTVYSEYPLENNATGISIDRIEPGETITITYQVIVEEIPNNVGEVLNIVTDDGSSPLECTSLSSDCYGSIIEMNPSTLISKTVSDENGDMIASSGEELTYQITVTNPNVIVAAKDVIVRDSILEDLPDYLTIVSSSISPSDVYTTGSILNNGITIDTIAPNSSVVITYVLKVEYIPDDISSILNIVTDNGDDPSVITPEQCVDDCDSTETIVDADTVIEKSIVSESILTDGLASLDEVITYQLKVTNLNQNASAIDVIVRDSMFENLPDEVTIESDFTVIPPATEYSGDLGDGDLTISEIAPGESVYITYSIRVNAIDQSTEIANVVTDDGSSPIDLCYPGDVDCDIVIVPIKPETVISKVISDESIYLDNLIEDNESITYTISIENISSVDSYDVPVRDSVVENLDDYPWLELESMSVNPTDANYSGSMEDGSFMIDVPALSTVEVTYTLSAGMVPSDDKIIANIATDDGTDPRVCGIIGIIKNPDCAVHLSLLEADTSVIKNAYDQNNNGVIEDGETIRYSIDVTNYTNIAAIDTPVRDSLLEDLPSYAHAEIIAITDTHGNNLTSPDDYSGSLEDGDFVINRIARRDTVSIIYEISFDQIPDDVTEVANIVRIDGEDPSICTEDEIDCSEIIFPVEGDTIIDKQITSESMDVDGVIEEGEVVSYQLTVTNNTLNNAVNVQVRDSLLENIPSYASLESEVMVTPVVPSSGSLLTGDYIISEIESGETVTISYSLRFNNIPDDVEMVTNVATDNREDPQTCSLPMRTIINDDCATATIDVNGTTEIIKDVVDKQAVYRIGDNITYELTVSNKHDNPAYNVNIRDSLLENTPDFLKYNQDLKVDGANYRGDITSGSLVLDVVPANGEVKITYSMKVISLPEDSKVNNIATDNGSDPIDKGKDKDTDNVDVTISDKLVITGGNLLLILITLGLILIIIFALKSLLAKK